MKRIIVILVFLLVAGVGEAAEDYVKVRYNPGYTMSGFFMEMVVKDSFDGKNSVIANVYAKLKEIEQTGRLEFVWPDAVSILIEVRYRDEVIRSSLSPKQSQDSDEFRQFQRLWQQAYRQVWESIQDKFEPQHYFQEQ